jgi:cell wall-associated NlpC family hydrolase
MGTAVKAAVGITAGLISLVIIAVTGIAGLTGTTASGAPATELETPPSKTALTDIPARMLTLYRRAAATCPGLPWTVVAAIGKTETDHARNPHMTSTAGAVGPMQFLPATFNAYANPVPPGGKKPPTPWDTIDAVYATTHLLCANGAHNNQDLRRAIFDYNHNPAYVNKVLHIAATYSASGPPPGSDSPFRAPTPQAALAIAYAHAQLGRPYVWGGDGPTGGDAGFDCSGLTRAAYAAANIPLPRVAQDQYDTSPHVPHHAPLLPGDLVFYGTPSHVHHVGIYIGGGHMIDAPHRNQVVREEPYRYNKDDYLGATRPSTTTP